MSPRMIDSIHVKPTDLFSRFEPSGCAGRFFNFPLARILVVVAFFVPVAVINALVIFQVIEKVAEPWATQIDVVRMFLTFVLILVTYKLYCNLFERRPAPSASNPPTWQRAWTSFWGSAG
jgi:hypothetical protein